MAMVDPEYVAALTKVMRQNGINTLKLDEGNVKLELSLDIVPPAVEAKDPFEFRDPASIADERNAIAGSPYRFKRH